MSIFLVRHGETEQNAARVVQVPESPLSALGRAQAERLARRVAGLGVTRILASDLPRAVETAAYAHKFTGVAVEFDPLLRERDFGDLRGTPYAALTFDPFAPDYLPPNGESWAVFHARVALAWERVTQAAAATAGNLLVVTHGLVCRALAERQLRLSPGLRAPAQWANTGLSEIDSAPPWTLRLVNCAAHLAVEAAPGGAAV
ncbi:MAG: histidine phosphatase family protein [Nevskia sp.]|nr:histidine phosphatase family protein [Nevskia sp.]